MWSHGAHRLQCAYDSSSAMVNSCTGFNVCATALFTSTSIGPNASSVRATSVSRPPAGITEIALQHETGAADLLDAVERLLRGRRASAR